MRFHRGKYFRKIRFPCEHYYTRVTSEHVPEPLCGNFRCRLDRGSPKLYFPETLAAMRLGPATFVASPLEARQIRIIKSVLSKSPYDLPCSGVWSRPARIPGSRLRDKHELDNPTFSIRTVLVSSFRLLAERCSANHSSHFISHKVFSKSFCKSQLLHRFVNLFFTITNLKNTFSDLCGN